MHAIVLTTVMFQNNKRSASTTNDDPVTKQMFFSVLSWSECEGMRPAFNHKSFGPFDTKERANEFLEQQLKPRHDALDDAYEQREKDEEEKGDSQTHDHKG